MPEIKVSTHDGDGHHTEHTIHLPYDAKGHRMARKIIKLAKSASPKRELSGPVPSAPAPKSRRRMRSKR